MEKNRNKYLAIILSLMLLIQVSSAGAFAVPKSSPELVLPSNLIDVKNITLPENLETSATKIFGTYDFNSKESIKVIVELEEDSIIEAQLLGKKQDKQSLEKIRKDIINTSKSKITTLKVNREYDYLISGFSVTVPSNRLKELANIPGVKAIYPNVIYQTAEVGLPRILSSEEFTPDMMDSAPFIGAIEAWASGYDGEGVTVAVIDTGVDYLHPALKHAFDESNYGYDFVDNDEDPMEYPGEYHGTHVSGTIAGYDPGIGFSGIAPKAKLVGYRVLGPDGGSTEDVIAGIELAVEEGADIMNLSLGNTLNAPDWATSIALDNAMASGVVAVTSNGNSGPDAWTVGSPGTSRDAISVGATMQPYKTYTSEISVSDAGNYPSAVMGYPTDEALLALNGQTYELVYGNLGYPKDLNPKVVAGKVVLIQRGELAFVDKATNALNAGAVAILIYDHKAGNVMPDIPGTAVPTFKLTKETGEVLKASMDSMAKSNLTISFNTAFAANVGETIADFSSRGPVIDTWMIKPDLSAPGVDIVSSVPGGKYASLQGTSMSSPHVAGAAALVLGEHPDYTPEQVKAALMNTAVTVYEPLSTLPAPLNAQGAGSIRLVEAVEAKTLVTPGSHSFGVVYNDGETVIREKSLSIFNTTSDSKDYTVAVNFTGNPASIVAEFNSVVTVAGETTVDLPIKLTIDTTNLSSGFYEGDVVINDGTYTFNVPVILFINEPDYVRLTHIELVLSKDGNLIWGYLPRGAEVLVIAILVEGADGFEILGYTHYAENLAPGEFEYEWDGSLNGQILKPGNYYMYAYVDSNGVEEGVIFANFNAPIVKGKNK